MTHKSNTGVEELPNQLKYATFTKFSRKFIYDWPKTHIRMQNEEPILQTKQLNCKPSCKLSPKKALNRRNWNEKNKIQRRELCDPQTISSILNSSEEKSKILCRPYPPSS
jgi:hypothetical protein